MLMKRLGSSLIIACSLFGYSFAAEDLSKGLVAHWPMNELRGDSTMVDVGPHKRDALTVDVAVVDGRGGKVFAFDGKNSSVFVPDDAAFGLTGDYSVAFWIRQDPEQGKDGPIYAQPSFNVYTFRGLIRVTIRNPEYPGTGYSDLMGPQINDGEWHQVTFSYLSETGESFIFLDGVEVARKFFNHKPDVEGPTTIGSYTRFFLGAELSDMRVYSRALDERDAAALFEQTVSR